MRATTSVGAGLVPARPVAPGVWGPQPQRRSGRLRQWETHTHAQGGYKTLPYVYYGGGPGAAAPSALPHPYPLTTPRTSHSMCGNDGQHAGGREAQQAGPAPRTSQPGQGSMRRSRRITMTGRTE